MTKQWLVLKFGGTSVSGRQQWDAIAALAQQRLDGGFRVLLVCSAVAGITNALQSLADQAGGVDDRLLAEVFDRHRQLADALGVDASDLISLAGQKISHLLKLIGSVQVPANAYGATASLLALGEWLSTKIGERFLAGRIQTVEWVDACEALQALPEANPSGKRARLSARCHSGPDPELRSRWAKRASVLITQGFVAAHPGDGVALLGRGGSDTAAALLASRLEARHVEIWTDVPGFFSADPRVIPDARLLRELNYDEALEMAASGAKVVHSRCIRAAADGRIPIQVRDLGHTTLCGTVIQADDGGQKGFPDGVRGVCWQRDMVVLLLQNLDTREQVGFLARVFTEISAVGVSIDLVATSETTTTVAINRISNHLDDATLEALVRKLREQCAVTVFPDCAGINLVGRGARVALADIDPGSVFFAGRPLLMLSQSANDLCISLLVHSSDAEQLLVRLHAALIGKRLVADQEAEIFGPCWQDLLH